MALLLGAAVGCGGTAPVVATPLTPPPVARNLLNLDDLASPSVREDGALSPARPVARTAMRRELVSAVFSPDSKRIFAVSTHGELVAYDVASGALRGYARPWYDGTYPQLQVDRSGSRVLVVNPERAPVLWDLRSDTLRTLPNLEGRSGYFTAGLHPDGDQVARTTMAANGAEVVATQLDDDSEVRAVLPGNEDTAEVAVIRYSPSGARLAVVTNLGNTFVYLNASNLEVVRTDTLPPPAEGEALSEEPIASIFSLAFRPQGGQVALGRPGRIELLDSLTAAVRADIRLSGANNDLHYSADGRWLVANSTTEVVVIEAETGRVSGRVLLAEHGFDDESYVTVSAVLPGDGGFFALSQHGDALHFDASGAARQLPETALRIFGGVSLLYSPDGAWQFVGGAVPAITRVGESEPHMQFVQDGSQVSVWGADFSADGRTLYTRSRNGVSRFGADGMRTLSCGNEGATQRGREGQLVQHTPYGACLFERDLQLTETQIATRDGSVTASLADRNVTVRREGTSRTVRLNLGSTFQEQCVGSTACFQSGQLAQDGSALGFVGIVRTGNDSAQHQTWWELYDTRTGRLRAQGTRSDGYFGLHLFTGGMFAIRGESSLTLHDARGRQRLAFETVYSWATSNDERLLVVQTSDRVVHVVDTVTLRERETWTAPDLLVLMRVTPDGLRLVARDAASAFVSSIDGSERHSMRLSQDTVGINFAGTYALTCDGDVAVRVDTRTGERVDVAPCDGRPDAVSEDGTLAVLTVGSSSRVHRLSDGRVLTLETLVGPSQAALVAYDDTGRWDLSHLDAESVRIRAAGPGESASLDAPEAASRTDGLVGLFLRGE